ncbi:MAG: hypothetical protein Athens101428_820, partial [Candidatus Berkelbacteria bacterium Athens1014_28]
YYVGFNNKDVKFNLINTLQVYGSNNSKMYDQGMGIRVNNVGEKANEIGDIYLKLYAANYKYVNDQKILAGATIEDLGAGQGLYTYRSSGSVTDFFDLYDWGKNFSDTGVFYDNVRKGISALAKDNNYFVYQFDTVFPFSLINFNLTCGVNNTERCFYYYSFDEQNWQKVEQIKGNNPKAETQFQIVGAGEQKRIYLKVTYNKDDNIYNRSPMFSIERIIIDANLIIK